MSNEARPRTREWRRWQLDKKKRYARRRMAQWKPEETVWEDRRYIRQEQQMNRWYTVGKRETYRWKRKGWITTMPWYIWQTQRRSHLWNDAYRQQNEPRVIGHIAVTPRGCSSPRCCKQLRTNVNGLRISELRRTTTVREAVAEIFDERDAEVEAAYAEAMLLAMRGMGEDWYEDSLGWTAAQMAA